MSKRYGISCEFCLKELDTLAQSRLYDMARKHGVAMSEHKPSCPNWNEAAVKVHIKAG